VFAPPYDPETVWVRRECAEGTCNPDWKPRQGYGLMPESTLSLMYVNWPPENLIRLRTICEKCGYHYICPDSVVVALGDVVADPDNEFWMRNFDNVLLPARERVAKGEGKPGEDGSWEALQALKSP
jgi:hypothetical protein